MDSTTILIVDDEPTARDAMEGVLFSEGYQLVFAENGQEGFEKALVYLPDVILLDVMMPGLDGYETCRMIRKNPTLREIPVLMVTALDDRESKLRGIEAGADDFLNKPFDRMELVARLRTIVRLNRYRNLMLERARFAWVVENAQEGYVVISQDDHILYANPAAQGLLHLPTQSAGMSFLAHVREQYHLEPEENWEKWPAVVGPLLLVHLETEYSAPVYLNAQVLSLQSQDKTRRLIHITDVTEKFALERDVWNFQQMISHKLQTPMAQILMAAELIHGQLVKKKDADLLDISEAMLVGAQRLKGEVQEVVNSLHFSEVVQAGQPFSMKELPGFLSALCQETGVENVQIYMEPALAPYSLTLSGRATGSIFREVIENARKFHPRLSPRLEIDLVPYQGSLHSDSPARGAVRVKVMDDGISLSAEQLRNVWQPYYQAEKDLTGEVPGMGLGLSCVARLVWEAGGKYRMYNRGQEPGIVVDFVLPLV